MNLAGFFLGVKGVSKTNADGVKKMHLNDVFSVFSKIKGTPKYWQVARNDLVAKVKQLGAFHIFFTFSCGEKRWAEVYLSLFKRRGYKVKVPEKGKKSCTGFSYNGPKMWNHLPGHIRKTTIRDIFKE